jgi:hypothetical protein
VHRIGAHTNEREGNTEVSWLNGATDLATCVKSFGSGVTAASTGDWATLGASASTIVGKGIIYAVKQNKAVEELTKAGAKKTGLPTPTAIVDCAALIISLVDLLNGFGSPNSGSAVSTASDKFDLFMKDLNPGCIPDARDWSGTAATAYIGQVNQLTEFTKTMKEYDKQLKGYLGTQAASVKQAHLCCTVNVAVLTAAAGIALALYLIPVVGPEVSQAWQIIAAFACGAATFVVEMLTVASGMSVSNDVAALAKKYVTLGSDVDTKLAGSFGKIEGKIATDTSSKLSSFRGISDGLTAFSFAPSVSSLAAKAGDSVSTPQRALLDASSEREVAAASSSAGAQAETPSAAPAPVAPTPAAAVTFTPPSLAQMSQVSSQLSQMSQPINSLGQTINQGVSQIQQAAQSAKGPGDPAAAPADQVDDVKDAEAGAAAGGEGAERAPIDAAKSGAEATGAGRERVL